MGIFAKNQRFFGHINGMVKKHVKFLIHRAIYVGIRQLIAGILRMYGTARLIISMDPVVCSLEITAGTCLISKRPDYHTRMVFVSLKHTFGAVNKRFLPFRLICKTAIRLISHTVALYISLVDDIHAIYIAEFIPPRIIRIMRSTHTVDVVLFHKLQITDHRGLINHMTGARIMLVAVHTFDIYRFAIHKKLRMFDLTLTKTYIAADILRLTSAV